METLTMRIKFPFIFLLASLVTSLAASPGLSDSNLSSVISAQENTQPVVSSASRSDTSPQLRDIAPIPPTPEEGPSNPKPRKWLPNREGVSAPVQVDPALQDSFVGPEIPSPMANFEGINNVDGVLPPDTVGDIGPNHYVQMVNLSFAVYNRSGSLLYGPANTNTIWTGFRGACANTNDGDPIVLYDELADRWLVSQFALPNFPSGPFYECIAVSQTGDPLGAWHRYQFLISNSKLDDYPKFGVWPDGYYMSINQFTCNLFTCNWAGQGAVAFDRDKMLAGQSAQMVYFDLFSQDPNLGGMLPSDLDGPLPPANAPNLFVQVDDDAWGYSGDQLQIWQFDVNWSTPSSSTFTNIGNLPVASFDSNLCGYARNCLPQPGGVNVDAISDRLMYRLQYRNFGAHQTLVTNHTVDVNGSDRAGIRWYELRNSGGGWNIFQQGTFSPDANHRWMGSVAMNAVGDIGLGYSVSSTSVFPSIRYTGRLDGDPTGEMTQGEGTIITGSGYQQHSSGRWGDYSMMGVDPTDDCTFWYTQEYYAVAGLSPWRTRVGAFKIRDCGGGGNHSPSVTMTNPAEGSTVSGVVNVQINATDEEDPAGSLQVVWSVDGGPGQSAVYNSSTGFYEASWDTNEATDGGHTLSAQATDSNSDTGSDSNSVTVDNGGGGTPTSVHVGDLDATSTSQGATWTAMVTITVHDNNHNPVVNVSVRGKWTAGATGTAVCTTDSNGVCTASKGGIANRKTSATFSITKLTHATLPYVAASNHDPDGDSTGTGIVVTMP
jgi:hypothetical protein